MRAPFSNSIWTRLLIAVLIKLIQKNKQQADAPIAQFRFLANLQISIYNHAETTVYDHDTTFYSVLFDLIFH